MLLEDKKQVAFVYYKNEDAYIARQRNVGFIRIDNSRINVIGEYLTHKNAFSVVTERSNYIFIPESRSVLCMPIHTERPRSGDIGNRIHRS